MPGSVGILNVGAGDTKLVFDPKKPEETARAARIVKDMIRRGFAILIEAGTDKKTGETLYRRAHDFDENTAEYIIAGDPGDQEEAPANEQKSPVPPRRSRQGKAQRFAAAESNAVAVARTAGG